MTQITDGTGIGNKAKIDGNNRLTTSAITSSETAEATHLGNSYNINTGVITLTDDVDTPVLYLKNNETAELHITGTAYGMWTSTGGSPTDIQITLIRNPTVGTIITNANPVAINSNRNYGSAQTLDTNTFVGATGDTMTDGEDHIIFYLSSASRIAPPIDELIPKGSSIGIKIKPPAGNTSMQLYAAILLYLEDLNV